MEQVGESAQAQDEEQCIETFLNWYNKRFENNLIYERAEKVIPEIANSTRWDFIIKQKCSSTWHAVEIKRLIRPEVEIQRVNWNRFLKRIIHDLQNCLQGEFIIYGVPNLWLEREKRIQLKRVLTEVITYGVRSLKNGEEVDLGSQILSRFPDWPHTENLNMSLSSPVGYKVVRPEDCFTLGKVADTGCSLELIPQSGVFILNRIVEEALTSLFEKGEMSQANTQLALAKHKGAMETILLLDYHLPPSWYPNHAKQVLANRIHSAQFADIGCIYLVKASQNLVSKVWG